MKMNFMRAVDFWIGLPLCWLVSLFRSLLPRKNDTPKHVLLIELSEMGSAILVDPALRKLASAGKDLYFVIFNKNKASLHLLETIPPEHIFGIRSESFLSMLIDSLRFLFWCRKNKIDTVVDIELFSRCTALLAAFCGASMRVGFSNMRGEGLYRGRLFTHYVAYNPHIHIAKNFVALADRVLDISSTSDYPKRVIQDEEIQLAQAKIDPSKRNHVLETITRYLPGFDGTQPLVLLNPNAGDLIPQRRWPLEHFKAVAHAILDKSSALILVTGSPSESAFTGAFVKSVDSPRCVNFAGAVRFEELSALYDIADILVTNDSGPAHFAAVTGIFTVVLFGPETPKLYKPLGNTLALTSQLACSPCVDAYNQRNTACTDNQCMKCLNPETVIAPILEQLRGLPPRKDAALEIREGLPHC